MTYLTALLTLKNALTAVQFLKKNPKKSIIVILLAILLSSGYIEQDTINQAIEIFNEL